MPLKTLFLNPPSFENFDGGASSRWPATREIESYWYPVWLTYPAGMLEGSRLLDAPPHHVSAEETIKICKDYEFLVLFTSTVGWEGDQRLAEAIKAANPSIRIAFVGPPVTTSPDKALNECSVLDFICRREFDYSVVEFAQGKPLNEILGISYVEDGPPRRIVHNPDRPQVEDLDAMPWATKIYKRDMDVTGTTCRSCCIRTSRSTLRAAARRSARSACGRRHSAGTRGASGQRMTWPPSSNGPRRTSRT